MKELMNAVLTIQRYNSMDLYDCVREFEKLTGQHVPATAVENFRMTGLNNVDFFTSDYLERYGLDNIFIIN